MLTYLVTYLVTYSLTYLLTYFEQGQQTRRLTPCGHLFHTSCIDEWLERRLRSVPRLACPVCSVVIDDAQPEEESDPSVARDLAWLTELRRSHPGFFW